MVETRNKALYSAGLKYKLCFLKQGLFMAGWLGVNLKPVMTRVVVSYEMCLQLFQHKSDCRWSRCCGAILKSSTNLSSCCEIFRIRWSCCCCCWKTTTLPAACSGPGPAGGPSGAGPEEQQTRQRRRRRQRRHWRRRRWRRSWRVDNAEASSRFGFSKLFCFRNFLPRSAFFLLPSKLLKLEAVGGGGECHWRDVRTTLALEVKGLEPHVGLLDERQPTLTGTRTNPSENFSCKFLEQTKTEIFFGKKVTEFRFQAVWAGIRCLQFIWVSLSRDDIMNSERLKQVSVERAETTTQHWN